MARISPIEFDTADGEQLRLLHLIEAEYGTATNMKRTLVRSGVALHALLEWYPLYRKIKPLLGERLTTLFAFAISTGSECLLCSTYFRKEIIDAGEDPADLVLDEREETVITYGARLATDPNKVDDDLFARLAGYFSEAEIVDLTAFATLMIATNTFNSALKIDLDEPLLPYRAEVAGGAPPAVAAPHHAGEVSRG